MSDWCLSLRKAASWSWYTPRKRRPSARMMEWEVQKFVLGIHESRRRLRFGGILLLHLPGRRNLLQHSLRSRRSSSLLGSHDDGMPLCDERRPHRAETTSCFWKATSKSTPGGAGRAGIPLASSCHRSTSVRLELLVKVLFQHRHLAPPCFRAVQLHQEIVHNLSSFRRWLYKVNIVLLIAQG